MTFTTVDPANLESILTSFGQLPFNLEVKTTTSHTYLLPTTQPLTDYVMNIAQTSDSTGSMTVNGINVPVGTMVTFMFSHETSTWYNSTAAEGSGMTQLTG